MDMGEQNLQGFIFIKGSWVYSCLEGVEGYRDQCPKFILNVSFTFVSLYVKSIKNSTTFLYFYVFLHKHKINMNTYMR